MTYVKVDDQFPEHPKVISIGALAEALWLRGLCYASRNLTDGFIPEAFVRRMHDLGSDEADALIDAGLWDQAPGGYRMHDYADWQSSREEIEELRQKRAEAGRRGGIISGVERSKRSKNEASASQVLEAKRSKRQADTDTDTDTDTERVSKTTSSHPPAGGRYTDEFESFWKPYPATNGSKADAFKAWKQLTAEQRAAAIAALPAWLACDRWREGYVKHAGAWLRGRMWEVAPANGRASPNGHGPPVEVAPEKLAELQQRVRALGYQGEVRELT